MNPQDRLQLVKIVKSRKPGKKYDAVFKLANNSAVGGKTPEKIISFGASGYSDYTIHKDIDRMKRYQMRHKNDNLSNPLSPGALSWYVLWSSPTLEGGISNYRMHFKL